MTRLDVDDNTRNRFLSLARITGASERCVPVNSVHLSATLAAVDVTHGVTFDARGTPTPVPSRAVSDL